MPQWFFDCNVILAGASVHESQTVIGLTDRGGAFTNRQFIAANAARKELLAAGLTAMSTGYRVQASIDDGAPEFGTLHALYIINA